MIPSEQPQASAEPLSALPPRPRQLRDVASVSGESVNIKQSAAEAPRAPSSIEHLVRIEGELRGCTTRLMLWQHLVNETAVLLPFGQSLVLEGGDKTEPGLLFPWQVIAASGLAQVQSDSLMVRWYQRLVANLWQETEGALQPLAFALPRFADMDDPCTADSALRHLLWVPLTDAGHLVGAGWLLAGEQPWEDNQKILAQRLALAYAHGAHAIAGRSRPPRRLVRKALRLAPIAALVLAALAFIPVPLTTQAPVEVAPQKPFVVAAPVAGVVDTLMVQPGAQVQAGDALVQLVDTALRSDYEVAQQRFEVSRAKTLRLQQAAVSDPEAKRELAISQSEQSVAAAEREYARAMLSKTVIRAAKAGVALYSDPRDWVGRPVAVGEAIMRVADPRLVEFQLKVPVADAVNLRDGAQVRIFLDAAPLDPINAKVVRAAYKAETDAAGIANFQVTAEAVDASQTPARLGLRGTARVYGEKVSLFYYLLRRPIVALRQWSGV